MAGVPDQSDGFIRQNHLRNLQGTVGCGTIFQNFEAEPKNQKVPRKHGKCSEISNFGGSGCLSTRIDFEVLDGRENLDN